MSEIQRAEEKIEKAKEILSKSFSVYYSHNFNDKYTPEPKIVRFEIATPKKDIKIDFSLDLINDKDVTAQKIADIIKGKYAE